MSTRVLLVEDQMLVRQGIKSLLALDDSVNVVGECEDGSQLMEKEHAFLQYQTELIRFADSSSYLLPALVALRLLSPESDYERVPEFLVRQCEKWKRMNQIIHG